MGSISLYPTNPIAISFVVIIYYGRRKSRTRRKPRNLVAWTRTHPHRLGGQGDVLPLAPFTQSSAIFHHQHLLYDPSHYYEHDHWHRQLRPRPRPRIVPWLLLDGRRFHRLFISLYLCLLNGGFSLQIPSRKFMANHESPSNDLHPITRSQSSTISRHWLHSIVSYKPMIAKEDQHIVQQINALETHLQENPICPC